MELKVMTTIHVYDEDIDDIVESAFSDSVLWSGYCGGYKKDKNNHDYIGKYIANGGTFILTDPEEDNAPYELNREVILRGIETFFEMNNGYFAVEDISWVQDGRLNLMDSWIADCIIQCGIFGDVIYG